MNTGSSSCGDKQVETMTTTQGIFAGLEYALSSRGESAPGDNVTSPALSTRASEMRAKRNTLPEMKDRKSEAR
jgi:hypothetical protein